MTNYYARVRAADVLGNLSAWSAEFGPFTTVKDLLAPPQPTGLTAVGGFGGAAVSWNPVGTSDFFLYQIRWGTDGSTWPGIANTTGTVYWVPSLTPGTTYYFQVRSVDTSGNTGDNSAPQVVHDYVGDTDWGYTSAVTAVPTQVGTADIAAATISAVLLTAGGITADMITSGKITLRPTGTPALEVRASGSPGTLLGYWSPTDGIKIYGATQSDWLQMTAGALRMFKGGVETVTITPDGITAQSLKSGTLDGGHNVVRNSSFELSSYVTAPTTYTFTDTGQWAAANGTRGRVTAVDNIAEGTDLHMTTATYA